MTAAIAGAAASAALDITLDTAARAPMPLYAVAPFVVLLLSIAAGPIAFPHLWHRHYGKVALGLGAVAVVYYWFLRREGGEGTHVIAEMAIDYTSFVALIGSLFVVASGILIRVRGAGGTLANVVLLGAAATMASVIGTTGASMLLIRPYLRLNAHRFETHHFVFFIFLVSNVGGALTPIGDPPLFIGYLLGIPFFWPAQVLALPWLFTVAVLLLIFALIDTNAALGPEAGAESEARPVGLGPEARADNNAAIGVEISGYRNFLYLFGILALVLLQGQPEVARFAPWSKLAAAGAMSVLAFAAFKTANPKILKDNNFSFEPVREVGLLFAGIFAAMIPALDYLRENASQMGLHSPFSFYFACGTLSAFLDNAPTYLTFLTADMAVEGRAAGNPADVLAHLADPAGALATAAISCSAVFFGAMTYIGNGPNLMVKAIVEASGRKVPGFFGYLLRWAVPVLLPILAAVGFLFFR